ncbi:hypothetical protein [Natronorubrum tibetense]|uniref:Uncharacterized protein n=1 Tax=Natronorubrum tibetense GA33 TaxID=1114856 RepID=L9VU97_9EURY|nr:hypothetical protein [Natronorubrum tibetense]ELY39848.1 hypothetical protein C496_14261 [Natronorubrum tibetense GA33]
MDLPIDPTQNDASPQELIRNLPSQAARRRVLQAADISIDVDDRSFADTLDELSQIELRRAASQLRFAGARTVYYYRVDGLRQVSPDGATGRVGDVGSPGAYGPEVQTAVRDHDRIYVVCNVPDTGSQTQLTISKENRPTTVATFKPRTQLLAVRASDDGTADATVQAVLSYLELDDATRISFLDTGFRGRLEDACVDGYSTLRLRNTNPRDSSREVEVRSKESETENVADVRTDAIVEDLLRRGDTELDTATGLVAVPTDVRSMEHGEPLHPRVTIGFPDGWVTFEQFVPEQVLIAFDNIVRESL